MQTRKRGPSLLEAINRGSDPEDSRRLPVPGWWSRSGSESPPAGAEEQTESPRRALADRADAVQSATVGSKWIGIDGSRLVISLSSFGSGILCALALIPLVAVFWLGQSRGYEKGRSAGFQAARLSIESQALDSITAARRQAANPSVFADLPTPPTTAGAQSERVRANDEMSVGPANAGDGRPAWVRGHTYIVVQEFLADDLADAEKAKVFLADHGIAAVIVTSSTKGPYRHSLISRQGFNCDDPEQRKRCEDLHDRIRKIGRLFEKGGGRYNLQGYQKKATLAGT